MIDVAEISKLQLESGDILIVNDSLPLSPSARKKISDEVNGLLAADRITGVTVLVMDHEASLKIVRKGRSPAADQPLAR